MYIRFYNARILTMDDNREIFKGELWVKDHRILYAGKSGGRDKTTIKWDREIDVKDNLIMPGFKNAHTHSAMTFLRSYADDLPLLDWLSQKVFPMEAKLTKDDIYHLTKLAIMEYLTSGITAIFDMYLDPEAIAHSAADSGMRCVQVSGLNDFSQSVELMDRMYQELNSNDPEDLNSYMLGFHAEYTCSRELLEKISDLAHKWKAPVYTHNSESKAEVMQCIQRTGMTPTAYLHSLGIFDYGGGGYHSVHLTDEDIAIYKKQGLHVITNPGSNAKLASGIAPIQRFLQEGINIGIGTDGPASNNCLDMFREMFLVTALGKLREEDAAAVDADKVLYMATVGGAKAMGLKDCDVLAEGKLADLIILDLQQPNMQPLNNITKNIVYSGSKQNVILTMVNGKILYENGEFHMGVSKEEVFHKANEIMDRMR